MYQNDLQFRTEGVEKQLVPLITQSTIVRVNRGPILVCLGACLRC